MSSQNKSLEAKAAQDSSIGVQNKINFQGMFIIKY